MTSCGIVGFGRIGRRLATRLLAAPHVPSLGAVLVRPSHAAEAAAVVGMERIFTALDGFLARRPDIVVECASAPTLVDLAPRLLRAGIDLIPLSLTALTDVAVERRLLDAATTGPGRLEIAPGAVGSLDLLATAREDGLARVVYRQLKSVAMWQATPAAGMADLNAIRARTVFLKGSVRDVARHFPHNLNVSVAVALAGLGLDRTEAELVADPNLDQTAHELDIVAAPGNAVLRLGGRAVPPGGDPVDYTTFSLLRLLRRRHAPVAI